MKDLIKNPVKIGIPRALLYYKYRALWETFLKNLGCQVVLSPETNRNIIALGASRAVDESCLSMKIFLGHIDYLLEKTDYIFIPHFVSLHRKEELCVKFMGMNDIARNVFSEIKILEYTVDIRKGKVQWFGLIKTGRQLGFSWPKSIKAYFLARKEYNRQKEEGFKKQSDFISQREKLKPLLLLVSHPYTTYDGFLGRPIIDFLQKQAVDIIYSDLLKPKLARGLSKKISKDIYWSFNKELLAAIEFYRTRIDGIIFLVAFPCGPDSLMTHLCQSRLKNIPIITLTLDALQGEAGLRTRLESFVDILKIKIKKHETKTN